MKLHRKKYSTPAKHISLRFVINKTISIDISLVHEMLMIARIHHASQLTWNIGARPFIILRLFLFTTKTRLEFKTESLTETWKYKRSNWRESLSENWKKLMNEWMNETFSMSRDRRKEKNLWSILKLGVRSLFFMLKTKDCLCVEEEKGKKSRDINM